MKLDSGKNKQLINGENSERLLANLRWLLEKL
jgi:hypothetical protein